MSAALERRDSSSFTRDPDAIKGSHANHQSTLHTLAIDLIGDLPLRPLAQTARRAQKDCVSRAASFFDNTRSKWARDPLDLISSKEIPPTSSALPPGLRPRPPSNRRAALNPVSVESTTASYKEFRRSERNRLLVEGVEQILEKEARSYCNAVIGLLGACKYSLWWKNYAIVTARADDQSENIASSAVPDTPEAAPLPAAESLSVCERVDTGYASVTEGLAQAPTESKESCNTGYRLVSGQKGSEALREDLGVLKHQLSDARTVYASAAPAFIGVILPKGKVHKPSASKKFAALRYEHELLGLHHGLVEQAKELLRAGSWSNDLAKPLQLPEVSPEASAKTPFACGPTAEQIARYRRLILIAPRVRCSLRHASPAMVAKDRPSTNGVGAPLNSIKDSTTSQAKKLISTPSPTETTIPASSSSKAPSLTYVPYTPTKEPTYLPLIRQLISKDLSEPYSIYVYRYFLYQWPDISFLAFDSSSLIGHEADPEHEPPPTLVGVVICKLEPHGKGSSGLNALRGEPTAGGGSGSRVRGYIAMLAVQSSHRGQGIASSLVRKAVDAMQEKGAEEIVLETETDNEPSLKLYRRLGFRKSKRLHRYYLNGNGAFRLVLVCKEDVGKREEWERDDVGRCVERVERMHHFYHQWQEKRMKEGEAEGDRKRPP